MTLSQLCNLSQLPLPHQRTTPCFLFLGTNVIGDGQCFKPAQFLIFISVTLDPAFNSSWSLKEDSCQSQDCSNLLHKPTGSTRSANAYTFQPTALAISYPVAEYGVPACCFSAYTKLVNVQLYPTTHTKSETSWCCHRCLQGSTPANFWKDEIVKATRGKKKNLCDANYLKFVF